MCNWLCILAQNACLGHVKLETIAVQHPHIGIADWWLMPPAFTHLCFHHFALRLCHLFAMFLSSYLVCRIGNLSGLQRRLELYPSAQQIRSASALSSLALIHLHIITSTATRWIRLGVLQYRVFSSATHPVFYAGPLFSMLAPSAGQQTNLIVFLRSCFMFLYNLGCLLLQHPLDLTDLYQLQSFQPDIISVALCARIYLFVWHSSTWHTGTCVWHGLNRREMSSHPCIAIY